MNQSSRNNSPRAGAAQTASIGDQDMMTFLPNASPATDIAPTPASDVTGGAAAGRRQGSGALDALDASLTTACGVPDPLMRFFARMTDDEAFDAASLDDLLTSVQTSPQEQEGEVSDLTATDTVSSLGELNRAFEQQQEQLRQSEEGALHHHHHHRHHKSDHQKIDSSVASVRVPQGNQLNYSSQGIVQLPGNVRFQPSQPISVSTGAVHPMTPLMGMDYSNVVNGGGGLMCFANDGIAQQRPQQQLSFAMMPQQQQSVPLGNVNGNYLASFPNSIKSHHQVGKLTQSATGTLQAPNFGQQQQHQQQTMSPAPWDVAASSMVFSSAATSTTASLTIPPQSAMPNFDAQQSSIYQTALKKCPNITSSDATKPNKRKKAPPSTTTFSSSNPPISEDESERKKRRSERNLREQERSHRITDRISELRTLLAEAGVHFKPDRYSTLVGVVNYIKMLQSRSKTLDEEHRRLINTISSADRLANGGGTTTVQTHNEALGEDTSRSSTDSNTDEEFLVFVQGIDYKFIFASCAVALAIASVDGRFVDCNDEFLRVTDYSRAELLGEESSSEEGGHSSNSGEEGGAKSPAIGGLVTVSTCTSANSSELTTAAAAAATAKSPSPELHTSFASRPPTEVRMRKKPHLSLFNLLGREDMETVYAAMSRMLKAPANSEQNDVSSSSRDTSNSSSGRTSVKESSSKDFPASSTRRGESSCMPRSPSSDSMLGSTTSSSGNEVSGDGISRYTVDHWSGMVKHTRRKEQVVRQSSPFL